ncbi:fimbria/pilus outer membrane usher protein [Ralstonia solanacearum]|uniref:Fimbrial biogenesis outer membrane usher protein n=1 Tax=Ralstonia solanacearum TaxID=305 RepID=A0AAD0SGN6_RALSL|nr:fimbrial biogenesis outer membrane usher protein [Ralstonia solanacearum]AXW55152.1 fimbrial biogenesis outer membrane usher protein [Ralstonia solanacearum]CBJ35306.1 putative fimbrial biogenesis outer membrane usher protein PapC [Ralstonia solanacearum PSI07]
MRGAGKCGRRLVAVGCGIVLTAMPLARAGAQAPADPAVLLAAARPDTPLPSADTDDLYLEAVINGTPTRTITRLRLHDGRLSATGSELRALGIRTDDLRPDANGLIALDGIAGLRYTYEVRAQQVRFVLGDARRVPDVLTAHTRPRVQPTSGTGLVLNYDAYLQPTTPGDGGASLGVFSEQRLFHPGGVFSNSGVALAARGVDRYTRLETNWSHSDPERLTTLRLGDTVTASLAWSRAVRLGGVQWQRNFDLRPDLVTYPLPQLSASAAVPTAVDLYVNNVRQFSGQVGGGPFVLNTTPAITGAGQAVIVVKDALGRDVVTSVPLYIDTGLLAAGLSDYAVEAGFLRNQYGVRSFDYAGSPALSASLRYGLSGSLTLESHAEAARGLANLGAGMRVGLGQAGVASGAASLAQGGGATGAQGSLGYQYRAPGIGIDLQGTRTFGTYRDLASTAGAPFYRSLLRGTVSVPVGRTGSVAASYIDLSAPGSDRSRIVSLSYAALLGRDLSLSASAYQDLADSRARGVLFTLSVALGNDTNAAASIGSDHGHAAATVSAVRTPDYGGGFGWQLQSSQSGAQRRSLAQLNYRGRYGDAFAAVQEINGRTGTALDVAGSLVLMDAAVLPGRRVNDAFALVTTEGMANVPVTFENRLMGRTNAQGHLLVPDLVAYENNRVAIDPLVLPLNARLATSATTLAPADRSGVLVRFHVETFQGAQLRLVDAQGQPLPAGSHATLARTGARYPIGYDGLAFIDALETEDIVRVDDVDPPCAVHVVYPVDADALPTLGPLRCMPREVAP